VRNSNGLTIAAVTKLKAVDVRNKPDTKSRTSSRGQASAVSGWAATWVVRLPQRTSCCELCALRNRYRERP